MRNEHTIQIPDEWLVPTVPDRDALAWSPGRYRLCFEVASGGMATVYLSLYHGPIGFERVVALKTIHPHLAKERQFVDMFLDEARIAAHIDHPFVCKVVDFGEARDSYYLAMEYLLGEPLSAVWEALQEKPALAASPELPFIVARLAADLCEGLHAAHELTSQGRSMGIVHRDVSPANLFALYDGTVRVVDFGIVKAENKLHHTETGTVKGKYGYLSPEQLTLKEIDRRSDIFSLGVVCWELLTGRRLFKHDAPTETMNAVMTKRVVPPSAHRERIPGQLDAVVLKALEREPQKRFTTARDMAVAFETFLGEQGRTVAKAEICEWMDELFPGEHERKRELTELTRRGDTAVPVVDRRAENATEHYSPLEPTSVRRRAGSGDDKPVVVGAVVEAEPMVEAEPVVEAEPAGASDDEATEPLRPRIGTEPTEPSVRPGEVPETPPAVEAEAPAVGGRALRVEESDRRPRRRKKSAFPFALGSAIALTVGVGVAYYTAEGNRDVTVEPGADGAEGRSPEPAASEDESSSMESTSEGSAMAAEGTFEDPWPPFAAGEGEGATEGSGKVNVAARGGGSAEIWLEGRRIGRTGEDLELPSGPHRLELRVEGSRERRPLNVRVLSDRTIYLNVTIEAER